jgi:hypothetical protein
LACEKQSHNAGRIYGTVSFKGTPPPKLTGHYDDVVCVGPPREQPLSLDEHANVKNVFVRIKDVPAQKQRPRTRVMALIDCEYQPRVLAIGAADRLRIINHDATRHIVVASHVLLGLDEHQQETVSAVQVPGMIKLTCQDHPWEEGFIHVISHHFYSITDAHGRFRIDDVPSGDYTLLSWHEMLEDKEVHISLRPGSSVRKDIVYSPQDVR